MKLVIKNNILSINGKDFCEVTGINHIPSNCYPNVCWKFNLRGHNNIHLTEKLTLEPENILGPGKYRELCNLVKVYENMKEEIEVLLENL